METLSPVPTIGDRDKLGYTIIWSKIYSVIPMLPCTPPPAPPPPQKAWAWDKDCSLPHLVLQDSGLEHSLFLYPKPMGYCPKLGAWAKLVSLQVYGVSKFQVYDSKDTECCRGDKMSRGSQPL